MTFFCSCCAAGRNLQGHFLRAVCHCWGRRSIFSHCSKPKSVGFPRLGTTLIILRRRRRRRKKEKPDVFPFPSTIPFLNSFADSVVAASGSYSLYIYFSFVLSQFKIKFLVYSHSCCQQVCLSSTSLFVTSPPTVQMTSGWRCPAQTGRAVSAVRWTMSSSVVVVRTKESLGGGSGAPVILLSVTFAFGLHDSTRTRWGCAGTGSGSGARSCRVRIGGVQQGSSERWIDQDNRHVLFPEVGNPNTKLTELSCGERLEHFHRRFRGQLLAVFRKFFV